MLVHLVFLISFQLTRNFGRFPLEYAVRKKKKNWQNEYMNNASFETSFIVKHIEPWEMGKGKKAREEELE